MGATRENAISRERLAAMDITPASVAEHLVAGATNGWVSSSESRIVGFCIGESAAGEVLVLAVLPQFEGRGIGKTLLSLAVDWLRSFEPTRIWLGASSDPQRALTASTVCWAGDRSARRTRMGTRYSCCRALTTRGGRRRTGE